jgi:hypothetical protein
MYVFTCMLVFQCHEMYGMYQSGQVGIRTGCVQDHPLRSFHNLLCEPESLLVLCVPV